MTSHRESSLIETAVLSSASATEQVRTRLESSLHRRARELGYELKKIEAKFEQITVDGQVLTVTTDGEIVSEK